MIVSGGVWCEAFRRVVGDPWASENKAEVVFVGMIVGKRSSSCCRQHGAAGQRGYQNTFFYALIITLTHQIPPSLHC